jgi:hypothetical protein
VGGQAPGFTLLFAALVLALCQAMPFAAVARMVGESWHRVAAIAQRYVELAATWRARRLDPQPLDQWLEQARCWARQFVAWYNTEHRHSGIGYVTPAQRHAGQDHAILGARHALYLRARERNPRRWSRQTRNWTPVAAVTLNPERAAVIAAQCPAKDPTAA